MTHPLMARFQYCFAQPWSSGVVYPTGLLRYTHRREVAVVEPGPAVESSLGGSLQPRQRLSGCCGGSQGYRVKRLWGGPILAIR